MQSDTTLVIEGIEVRILFPKNNQTGCILALPGWNFSKTDCCEKSEFCKKASEKGFILVLPEMGKSVYSGEFYKETRKDWTKYPNREWVISKMIPQLQKNYNLLKPGGNNFLYGISTGARGVALIAMNTDSIFLAGACLSGDFDQSKLPGDNLMKGYYGSFEKFPERWNGTDNPSKNINKLKIPLFIAHGKLDKVVPFDQSETFKKEIHKTRPKQIVNFVSVENAGHDYSFWNSQTDAILKFFSEHCKK